MNEKNNITEMTEVSSSSTMNHSGGKGGVRFCSYEEVPLFLGANDIVKLTGLSRTVVYYLMRADGFPVITVGKRRMVRKEKLFEWLDAHEELSKPSEWQPPARTRSYVRGR